MKIIESVSEWNELIEKVKNIDILAIPILTDQKTHPAMNPVCVFAISTGLESFLIGLNHNEVESLPLSIISCLEVCHRVWTPNKSGLMYIWNGRNIYDTWSLEYLHSQTTPDDELKLTNLHNFMYSRYDKYMKINKSVPIMKHIEYIESIFEKHWNIVNTSGHVVDDQSYKFLNDIAIPTLWEIERHGLVIDEEMITEKYGSRIKRYVNNNIVYSQYNLYTTTGRCSNRFAGINFASLNKTDGTREMFVSRHENGVLVMADFESFHLRLIADMIGYEFPMDIPVHEFLGKQYFDKDVLTQEEYDEGKSITFKLLYGEDRDMNVPDFFVKVYKYIDMLMTILDTNGYIQSPYHKRKIFRSNIHNPTPSKVFNYMIQLAETEKNLSSIHDVLQLFTDKSSVPILYTYDSVLFDYNPIDGIELLKTSIDKLSGEGKFPMRIYFGTNYNNLKGLSI